MNVILICYSGSQVFELCYVFEGFASYLIIVKILYCKLLNSIKQIRDCICFANIARHAAALAQSEHLADQVPVTTTTVSYGSPSLLSLQKKLEPIISLIVSALARTCTHPLLCSLGVLWGEVDGSLMSSGQPHSY
jgi:hypothetical protein